MRTRWAKTAMLVAVFSFPACAGVRRAPAPSSVGNGLLIARVETRGALIRAFVDFADSARVEQLDEKGEPVPGVEAASGLSDGKYVYFFDLPPGRYVLTSSSFPSRLARYQVNAPADAKLKRSVTLKSGGVGFLGTFVYDAKFPEFDVAVERAVRVIGHWPLFFTRRPVIPRDADLRLWEPGTAAEIDALRAARTALAGTQWRPAVEARLRELSAPEPAKTTGVIRSKELPLKEEPFLSWRDTLGWGEPRRAPAGLAWRRPGGEAAVVVFFTTMSAPGFAGYDAALAELRRAASASVEDTGEVYEVRVATRAGKAAKVTTYKYPEGTLVGSETKVLETETTLVPDGSGVYTARLRAPRGEFDAVLPAYREFLLQLTLGPPKPKAAPKQEAVMPTFQ